MTPSIVDLAVIVLVIVLIFEGWQRGLLKTLVGPAALVLSSVAGSFVFQTEHNIFKSLTVTVLSSLFLNFLFSGLLKIKSADGHHQLSMSWMNRLFGSFFNTAWGLATAGLTLILFMIIPEQMFDVAKIKEQIARSYSYVMLEVFIKDKIPFVPQTQRFFTILTDSEHYRQVVETPEFSAIYHNPKIQKIISDPKMLEEIKSKNFIGLLKNQEFLAVWQDKELIDEFINLNQRLQKDSPAK